MNKQQAKKSLQYFILVIRPIQEAISQLESPKPIEHLHAELADKLEYYTRLAGKASGIEVPALAAPVFDRTKYLGYFKTLLQQFEELE
jgi:hypothetical protein